MTLTLILMRHAKSDWDDPALDDFERPLNARGRRDAPRMGQWLKENDLEPQDAICSSAVRAKETLDGLGLQTPVIFLPNLYMAAPNQILSAIKAAYSDRLLVIAHNPGIGQLAAELVAQPPDHPQFVRYPTAATTVMEFDTDSWEYIALGTGKLHSFVVPRDLAE